MSAGTGSGRRTGRGYSWPPFERGNTAAVRHGAHSERRITPLAERYVSLAVEFAPYLDDPAYVPALTAWARAEARCELITEWLDEHGLVDPETGKPWGVLDVLRSSERIASEMRSKLGLDPLARAKLGRDVTMTRVALTTLFSASDGDGQALNSASRDGRTALPEAHLAIDAAVADLVSPAPTSAWSVHAEASDNETPTARSSATTEDGGR